MRQGHYKVAESYILYRAHRANLRLLEEEETTRHHDSTQESMIVVKRADGTSDLWDGSDLRRRIDFAGWQLNGSLLEHAASGAFVMHDLPAHRGEEITDEAIESPTSIVFDQVENRTWAQVAVIVTLLGLA